MSSCRHCGRPSVACMQVRDPAGRRHRFYVCAIVAYSAHIGVDQPIAIQRPK